MITLKTKPVNLESKINMNETTPVTTNMIKATPSNLLRQSD